MTRLCKLIWPLSIIFNLFFSSLSFAEGVEITIIENKITLTYPQDVRFSQVLNDAYANTKHDIYTIGSALIDPEKQPMLDERKRSILERLHEINTSESLNIANQLESLHFAYSESLEININRVRITPQFNPMIRHDYVLSLPKRPNHILLIDGLKTESTYLTIQVNSHLKDYLSSYIKPHASYDSAWIIQANQDSYFVDDIQWENTLFFLTPGAIVFTGLQNLPNHQASLNSDIASLLTHHLEP